MDSCIKRRAWQSDERPTEVIEFVSEGDVTFHAEGTVGGKDDTGLSRVIKK